MRLVALAVVLGLGGCGSISTGDDDGAGDGDSPGDGADSDGGSTPDSGTGGGGGTGPFIAKSGDRIKMRVLNTPDGAKQFQGWHDLELGVNCGFSRASDGMTRCLPTPSIAFFEFFYSDDACTVQIGGMGATCAAPSYSGYVSINRTEGTCPTVSQTIIHNGATGYDGPAYYFSGPTCTLWSSSGYEFYTLGSTVAASTFQEATEAIE